MGGKATQMGSGTNPEKLRQQYLAKKYGIDPNDTRPPRPKKRPSMKPSFPAQSRQQEAEKPPLPRLQSEGKTSLLSQPSTRSKGGGKSGGGGGKFGLIKRMIHRPASPFSLLKTDKNF